MSSLLRTPLYHWHVARGGRMVEFGGWEMPVQYAGIVEEHHAVRRSAGLFDISHMGRLRFRGRDAAALLDQVLTNHVATLKEGQVRYALVCQEDGGVLDDVLVSRLGDDFWLVVNASNRTKIVAWLDRQRTAFDVTIDDLTTALGMVAVQGPRALEMVSQLTRAEINGLKYYAMMEARFDVGDVVVSRTGYTGEDGFELIVAADQLAALTEALFAVDPGLVACGLGARDTLRLEAAMPLYGHELNENIDPLTAGLSFAVKFDKPDFIGKSALNQIAQRSDRPLRVGLKLAGRRIAREGAVVFQGEQPIGTVTSGTFSPTLDAPIAMAYLNHAAKDVPSVDVDIRGKRETAMAAPLPFYQRTK